MSSPDDVLSLFEQKAFEFKAYRDGNRKLIDSLKPLVNVVQAVSGVLGQVVSRLVSISPSRFHHSAATRFCSHQRERYSLAWIFYLQCVSLCVLR